jgi:prevent-host-death family protein
MLEIGVSDAQHCLSELVHRAHKGEKIILTENGEPLVTLVAPELPLQKTMTQREVIEALRDFGKMHSLKSGRGKKSWRTFIHQGHKY